MFPEWLLPFKFFDQHSVFLVLPISTTHPVQHDFFDYNSKFLEDNNNNNNNNLLEWGCHPMAVAILHVNKT